MPGPRQPLREASPGPHCSDSRPSPRPPAASTRPQKREQTPPTFRPRSPAVPSSALGARRGGRCGLARGHGLWQPCPERAEGTSWLRVSARGGPVYICLAAVCCAHTCSIYYQIKEIHLCCQQKHSSAGSAVSQGPEALPGAQSRGGDPAPSEALARRRTGIPLACEQLRRCVPGGLGEGERRPAGGVQAQSSALLRAPSSR